MKEMFYPHVSVDCVLMGIHKDQLSVLLVERRDTENNLVGYKLPGSLIYQSEDLEAAAYRVLNEATGLKRVPLNQFRSFGSPTRTSNKEDVMWLENASNQKITRIVTIAYLALCKSSRKSNLVKYDSVCWWAVDSLPRLPFDHKEIVEKAVEEIRLLIEKEPSLIFEYLPIKFTASQLRRTYEVVYGKEIDVRNFHKKMNSLEYVIPMEEVEENVAHRAARYYRFDKVIYNKQRSKLNKYKLM